MLIGLGYKARSGKDTIAEYLVQVHDFKRIAFADALKEGCRHIFGFTTEQLYGNQKEVVDSFWKLTPRHILQFVGTECLRNNFDKNIWIKAVEKKILESPQSNWVITDVRFPNEAEAVSNWNGYLVKVNRPNSGAEGGITAHASENSLDSFEGWDHIINNDIPVHAALYDKVEEMLEKIGFF